MKKRFDSHAPHLFIYGICRTSLHDGWGLGEYGAVLSQSSAPQLSLSVITSTFRELARLRPDFPSAVHMDVFLIPLIHH